MEMIYDEVKVEEKSWENKKKPHVCSPLRAALVSLGILCVVLVSVIITLTINFRDEQRRQNFTLTMQNQKLLAEKEALKRRSEDLSRERDRLNWTMEAILQYDNFPVNKHCPHRACKPCLDDWVPFQSNCYLFTNDIYYYNWKNWEYSRDFCQEKNADLVVIESLEEQEFINNHTKKYSDSQHGYWIGLSIKNMETWTWVDRSNVTLT
ncbi:asialoglycoprotein receptor 1-like [Nematolebias whitei]|uniref:asialoglycoprotein receptor 1-like n=1 Tax=Nematolebias whitei TaxID=451745 RepID=UPI0018985537|nr:asialoglycoprotein receptor 1-like [Nematolebias whitei]